MKRTEQLPLVGGYKSDWGDDAEVEEREVSLFESLLALPFAVIIIVSVFGGLIALAVAFS